MLVNTYVLWEQLPKLELVSVLHFTNSFLLFLGQFRYKRGIFRTIIEYSGTIQRH